MQQQVARPPCGCPQRHLSAAARRPPAPRSNATARPRVVRVQAASKAEAKTKKVPGFKWDPGMQRWVKGNNAELAQDADATLIKPRTGVAYQAWPVVWATIKESGVKSVSVQEAAKLSKKGWTIIDVRLAKDFEAAHAEGAQSLPMYRPVAGDGFWDNVKKAVMAVGFAMTATERNPNFQADALKKLKKNQKVLVVCAIGGTLDTFVSYRREKKMFEDPERTFGRESRSLKAVYELLEAGWSGGNIIHVEGGLSQWRFEGLPVEGGADEEDES